MTDTTRKIRKAEDEKDAAKLDAAHPPSPKRETKCGDCPGSLFYCETCDATRCWNPKCIARGAIILSDRQIRCSTCGDEIGEALK